MPAPGDETTHVAVEAETVGVGSIGTVTGGTFILNFHAAAAAPPPKQPSVIPPCPYKGLAFFGPGDAGRFFGRDAAIERLEQAVARQSFTALVGASGSGKSSVVLAGLAPRLHKSDKWKVTYFRIGSETNKDPFLALARALTPLMGEKGLALEEKQRLSVGFATGRIDLATALGECRTTNPGKSILVIADQFEEVFTLVADDARTRFIDLLLAGFPKGGPTPPDVALVLTLRADFYEKALLHHGLSEALQDRVVNLGPMTHEELREAIESPAKPVTFDDGLVGTLLDDVETQPGALPLLQFALTEMWGRLETPRMTYAAYEAIGGVKGALRERAEDVYARLTDQGKDAAAVARFSALFTRLVSFGEGALDTRRAADHDELGPETWGLAQQLAGEDSRLVVVAAATPGRETVEIAHEALIANWPALRGAIEANRAFGAWLKQLRVFLAEHRKTPDDEGALLRGGPLAVALDWLEKRGTELSAEERGFIERSQEARVEEARRKAAELAEREQLLADQAAGQNRISGFQRILWGVIVIAGVFIAIGIGAAFWKNIEASQLAAQVADKQVELEQAQDTLHLSDMASDRRLRDLNAATLNLEHKEAGLLGELAHAKLLEGDYDGALRLATKGVRDELKLPVARGVASPSSARLAAAVWNSPWNVTLGGHKGPVKSAAFSPDGARVVTASQDKTARVWDTATGKEIAALRGHEGSISSAAFSPDGARVVTASWDKTARVWDAATGKEIAALRGHEGAVFAAAFSPDGKRVVTASQDKTARVWDAATGKEIAALRGHEGWLASAAFSSDGARVVTASSDKTARLWDAATGEETAALRGHVNVVVSAAFSPDGARVMTASYDDTARVWDAATGRQIAALGGHDASVTSAAFSPDGARVVTASRDKTARVWDAATGKQIAVLRGHEGWLTSAAFSSDGARVVTASDDNTARVWDAATGEQIAALRGHEATVDSAAFSPDGARVVTASRDKTARLWDATTGRQIAALGGHDASVTSAAFSPDGARVVTASWDKTARVWDAATGKEIAALRGHEGRLTSAAFSSDGAHVVTASSDKTARVWDATTGKEIAALRGHENFVISAAFSPDGASVVTASYDNTARVWDAATGKEIAALRGHENFVISAAFSPDGARVVTASYDNTARVWDAATGKEIAALRGHNSRVTSAAFSPDGVRVVTASLDKTARLWDATTGIQIVVLRGHEGPVTSAVFSPDGARVATASEDNAARVWDAATGKEIAALRGHGQRLISAAFSSDGARIVTASDDNTARVWETVTGKEIAALRGHEQRLTSAAFSPDGARVVTASYDKTARIWDVRFATMPVEGLIDEVCHRRLPGLRVMTRDEMRLAGYPEDMPPIDVCEGVP